MFGITTTTFGPVPTCQPGVTINNITYDCDPNAECSFVYKTSFRPTYFYCMCKDGYDDFSPLPEKPGRRCIKPSTALVDAASVCSFWVGDFCFPVWLLVLLILLVLLLLLCCCCLYCWKRKKTRKRIMSDDRIKVIDARQPGSGEEGANNPEYARRATPVFDNNLVLPGFQAPAPPAAREGSVELGYNADGIPINWVMSQDGSHMNLDYNKPFAVKPASPLQIDRSLASDPTIDQDGFKRELDLEDYLGGGHSRLSHGSAQPTVSPRRTGREAKGSSYSRHLSNHRGNRTSRDSKNGSSGESANGDQRRGSATTYGAETRRNSSQTDLARNYERALEADGTVYKENLWWDRKPARKARPY